MRCVHAWGSRDDTDECSIGSCGVDTRERRCMLPPTGLVDLVECVGGTVYMDVLLKVDVD